MAMRLALFSDIIGMAFATLRTNTLRAGLTILGVVIGITAIVGMTSLIRGFDESLRDSIRQLGPNTLFVAKFSGMSGASGKAFKDLLKRPVLTVDDAKAIEREAPSAGKVDVLLGAWGMPERERAYYKGEKTKELTVQGVSEHHAAVSSVQMAGGRFFTESEVAHRRNVVVLGDSPARALFQNRRSDWQEDSHRRPGVRGDWGRRSSAQPGRARRRPGRLHRHPLHDVPEAVRVASRTSGSARGGGAASDASAMQSAMIAVVPADDATRADTMMEVEQIMRIRHGLKLDQANDFDIITQDAALKMYRPDHRRRLHRPRRHLVHRADGRRHRRDGDHDDLGDRADPRNRRPQGARRPAAGDPLAVPSRSGLPDVGRRRARHHPGGLDRPGRALRHRVPDLDALVELRPRLRLLRVGRRSSSASCPPSAPRGWIPSRR